MPKPDWTLWRAYLPLALAGVLPIVLFGTFFHWGILDPSHIGWILFDHGLGANDWGQHFLGWHAFRHSPWHEGNHQSLLAVPHGLSIIYTDSNPPLAFIFKALSPLLPDPFQYIGPWFLLCLCLHVFVAWKLVRPFASTDWGALGGVALLSGLPTLFNRMRHDTLMAHWLILWALWIFFHAGEGRKRRLWWTANLTLGAMIHPYLLFCQLAIFGGDVLRHIWPDLWHKAWGKAGLEATKLALVFIPVLVGLWVIGVFSGQDVGAVGYGDFAFGLDALFNPVLPEFSTLMKPHPQLPWQMFEGFQYLGAGLIGFLIIAFFMVVSDHVPATMGQKASMGSKARQSAWQRSQYLILPLFATLILALSHEVHLFNHTLTTLPLPQPLLEKLAVLRASGRLVWPIVYALILGALGVIYARSWRVQGVILVGCLMVQIIDLQGFIHFLHTQTVHAEDKQTYFLTPSPLWPGLIQSARQVDFEPPDPELNEPLVYEIAYRAINAGVPVTSFYAARPNAAQARIERAQRLDFIDGKVPPNNLAVFLNLCDAPLALRSRLKSLDGVLVLPPARYKGPLQTARPILPDARKGLEFGRMDDGACLLGARWAIPDQDGGTWSEGGEAEIDVSDALRAHTGTKLTLKLSAFFDHTQVEIFANDHRVGAPFINIKAQTVVFNLPSTTTHAPLRLRFKAYNPLMKTWARTYGRQFCFGLKLYSLKLHGG